MEKERKERKHIERQEGEETTLQRHLRRGKGKQRDRVHVEGGVGSGVKRWP